MSSPRDRYDSLIRFYADRFGLLFSLAKAQMLAESAANPDAVSRVGAMGLSQFMRATWSEWWDATPGIQGGEARWNPFNPEAAIRAQCAYLANLLKQFGGDTACALAAYNWGATRVRKHLALHGRLVDSALPEETRDYIDRIGRLRAEIEGLSRHHDGALEEDRTR